MIDFNPDFAPEKKREGRGDTSLERFIEDAYDHLYAKFHKLTSVLSAESMGNTYHLYFEPFTGSIRIEIENSTVEYSIYDNGSVTAIDTVLQASVPVIPQSIKAVLDDILDSNISIE
jgi:hypothetical protein